MIAFVEGFALLAFAGVAIAWVYRYFMWTRSEQQALDELRGFGSIGHAHVLAGDGQVVLSFFIRGSDDFESEREYLVMSTNDARQLAAWISLGAAPGRTLAQARMAEKKRAATAALS